MVVIFRQYKLPIGKISMANLKDKYHVTIIRSPDI